MLKKYSSLVLVFMLFISCKDDKITLVDSTGRINHVLIVMKNSDWQGKIGDVVREIIASPVEGLPQDEPQFSINQVAPETFNSLFKRTRNILFVGYDNQKNNFYANYNIYASPQTTLTILGNNEEELIANINKHQKEIISTFKNKDLALYQHKATKDAYNPKSIETFNKLGFTLKIPKTYNRVEDNGDFVWYRNNFTKGQMNIFAFEIPYEKSEDLEIKNIISATDSITKKYIPGQFEGTYMMAEQRFTPIVKSLELSSKKATEIRGLWVVKDDFMGGPFLSYAIPDKANHRIIIIEGFSYSPATKKRDFVFELEAILKTIKLG